MLITAEEAKKITRGLRFIARKKTNGYSGKFADIERYVGRYGAGYTVTTRRITEFYVYNNTKIAENVYNGNYSVRDACMTANNIHYTKFENVNVTPWWTLKLDTITGKTEYGRVETIHQATVAGRTLTISWRGSVAEKTLRRKIRRVMHTAVVSGKAKLI